MKQNITIVKLPVEATALSYRDASVETGVYSMVGPNCRETDFAIFADCDAFYVNGAAVLPVLMNLHRVIHEPANNSKVKYVKIDVEINIRFAND